MPMTIFGDGPQRGFCYGLVDGLFRPMGSVERYPANLGNPREMTILEFAERIRRRTGWRAKLSPRPLPETTSSGGGKPSDEELHLHADAAQEFGILLFIRAAVQIR